MPDKEKHIKELLPDYIAGALSADEEKQVKQHLGSCETCSKAYSEFMELEEAMEGILPNQPSSKLQDEVFLLIEEEKRKLSVEPSKGRQVFFTSWALVGRVAAAVLLLSVGYWWGTSKSTSEEQPSTELAEMKEELSEIKEMLLLANLKAPRPSERIQAVSQVEVFEQTDPKLVEGLLNMLNTDESPNVRLAAANALQRFAVNSDTLRAELVHSMGTQTDPIVQITLINMMVELQEKSAVNHMRTMIEDESVNPVVKKQAEIGLQILI